MTSGHNILHVEPTESDLGPDVECVKESRGQDDVKMFFTPTNGNGK